MVTSLLVFNFFAGQNGHSEFLKLVMFSMHPDMPSAFWEHQGHGVRVLVEL